MKWLKQLFKRKPEHDRELYVLKSGYAFVKCKRCGSESIPWQVPVKEAIEYNERHPDSINELLRVDKSNTPGSCRLSWW